MTKAKLVHDKMRIEINAQVDACQNAFLAYCILYIFIHKLVGTYDVNSKPFLLKYLG